MYNIYELMCGIVSAIIIEMLTHKHEQTRRTVA